MKLDIVKLAKEAWPEEYRYDTDDRYVTFKFEELQRFSDLILEEAAKVAYAEAKRIGYNVLADNSAAVIREMKSE